MHPTQPNAPAQKNMLPQTIWANYY